MGKSIPIQTLIARSQELERTGDVAGAFKNAREALERARSEKDAEAFYHRAADLSRETGYTLVRMRALHCLG